MVVYGLTLAALIIFRQIPGLDIFVSRLAFTVEPCPQDTASLVCGQFLLISDPTLNLVREFSLYLPFALGVLVGLYLLYLLLLNPHTSVEDLQKISLVIWTVLIATVGLVNVVLKELWGRPRPYRVEELGGDQPFILPGTISSYCDSNCSFVSGEASSATWLFAFLVYVPSRWRLPAGILIAAYLIFFSGLRVAFGRHFLSDVVLSSLLTLCVLATLRYLFSLEYFKLLFERIARWSNQFAYDFRIR